MLLAEIGLGEILVILLILYVIVAYFIALFSVIGDLFHSTDVSGAGKAVWVLALLFLPIISVVAYLIARGDGIGERNEARAKASRDAYTAQIAPPPPTASPTTELANAQSMLASGAIDQADYDALKARILGG